MITIKKCVCVGGGGGGGGGGGVLNNDKWYIYENFSLSSKFLVEQTFLSFGKYNNFPTDNFQYNCKYSNYSYIRKKRWKNG